MNCLEHHGILGQKWGTKNGPPYPLKGGDYSSDEIVKIYQDRKKRKNSIYNKKHFDKVIKKGSTLSTLSYDENRTKNTDMFYAAYKPLDKHEYNALFNKKIEKTIYDKNGNEIGSSMCYKVRINNKAKNNIKVASEDSASNVFRDLYSNDRDFYNYVTDKSRMQSNFVDSKYRFKGYRESRDVLDRLRNGETMSKSDIDSLYRMFNYTIPSDGGGNKAIAKDVATQRAKFFKKLKEKGYGACLDTNDAIYGGFKAEAPVIVFDMDAIVPKSIDTISTSDKIVSDLAFAGRKFLGI